jgi:mono/diheme cytochrome c family protein
MMRVFTAKLEASIWPGTSLLAALLVSLVAGLGAAYYAHPAAAQPAEPAELPSQPPSALAGQSTYAARCASCHGPNGAADGAMTPQLPAPPPSFQDVDHMREVTPAQYFDVITNGNMQALMPPWRDELDAGKRWDVLFYVWSLATSPEQIADGEAIYRAECAECHGMGGAGVEAIDFTDQARMAQLSQADLATGVAEGHVNVEWSDALTDAERWAAVDFVRTFSYDTIAEATSASGDGVIEGEVLAGTSGAEADLSGIEVAVIPLVGETDLPAITVTTDTEGRFRVTDLPTGADRSYAIRATYKGVDYFNDGLVDFSATPVVSVTVPVYETTTEPTEIRVNRNHIIIDFGDNQLRVLELYIVTNTGDRAYVGDGATLRFDLPAAAENVSFEDPSMTQSASVEAGEVVDTSPVPPGDRQVLLSYDIPYTGQTATFEKQVSYPTDNLNLLVADVGASVDAGEMVAGEPVATQGNTQFLNYTQRNLAAGQDVSVTLANLPRSSTAPTASVPADRSGTLRWLGLGLVLAALMFVAAYPALRPRIVTDELPEDETALAVLRRRRRMLLEELAGLDDAYDAGELAEGHYLEERAEVKAELIDVMQRLRGLETEEE